MPLALSLNPADVIPSSLLAVITHYRSVLADYDELRRANTLDPQRTKNATQRRRVCGRLRSSTSTSSNANKPRVKLASTTRTSVRLMP